MSAAASSILSPLAHAAFRGLWTGGTIYYIGNAMQVMAASWLMVEISGSSFLAALVQTAVFMPMFVLSLPAGVLADITDRRRLIERSLQVQAVVVALLAVLLLAGVAGPATLVFQAGDSRAVQQPAANVNSSSVAGPAQPISARSASSNITPTCTARERRINLRRSVVSASTPAGSASRNIGRNTAVCTSAARKEEPVSSTISHDAAMTCMALPVK